MAKASKAIQIKTPFGVAVYPSLHKLDTEGQYPTNKYKTDLLLSKEDFAKFKAEFKEKIKGEKFKTKTPKMPFKTDKDGNELVRFKSKYMPLGFDIRNKQFPTDNPVDVGGGSTIRVMATIFNYDDGISLQINQYQVKELKQWNRESAFDAEDDGYEHEGDSGGFGEDSDEGTSGDELDI